MRPALFLDRDGIINHDIGYLYKIKDFRFVEGILTLMQQAVAHQYLPVVVTNQSGVARGLYQEKDVHHLHAWLQQQFDHAGLPLIPYYFCPHHPNPGPSGLATLCECRKPKPGMLLRAISEHAIDPARSVMLGDKLSDMQAALAAGVGTCVLVSGTEQSLPAGVIQVDSVKSLLAHGQNDQQQVSLWHQ